MKPSLKVHPCVRSGLCCKTATCWAGLAHGAEPKGCKFLKGGKPGYYFCELAANDPQIATELYIGEGCCMSLFNTYRQEAVKNNPDLLDLFDKDGYQKKP